MITIKTESDLDLVRFKLENTYSCYSCKWEGGDVEVGREAKTDKGKGYVDDVYYSLYCPKCHNQLLSSESKRVYYG